MLNGDLNSVQIAARMVCKAYSVEMGRLRDEMWRKFAESIADVWMMLDHPQVWEQVRNKPDDGFEEQKLDELSADDMDEMIEKMRRVAGMLPTSP